MLVNISSTFVNGLQGTVSEIYEDSIDVIFNIHCKNRKLKCGTYTFSSFDPEKKTVLGERKQIQLKLCYAITIHKSQGMSLENVIVNCRNICRAGQLGVAICFPRTEALARSRESLAGLGGTGGAASPPQVSPSPMRG